MSGSVFVPIGYTNPKTSSEKGAVGIPFVKAPPLRAMFLLLAADSLRDAE
jgi:hypothetical protein